MLSNHVLRTVSYQVHGRGRWGWDGVDGGDVKPRGRLLWR